MLSATGSVNSTPMPPPPQRPQRGGPAPRKGTQQVVDAFEPASAGDSQSVVAKLRAENEMLKARIAELEEQLRKASIANAADMSTDSIEAVRNKRFEIANEIARLDMELDAAQKQHSSLLKAADDPESISARASELKKPKLLAKKTLQNEAAEFEDKTIKPLNEHYKQMQDELAQSALRLTKVTNSVHFDLNAFMSEFSQFLLKDPEKIRAAINPKPGVTPRDLKELLRPQLTKFLETKRPLELGLDEWVFYLGSPNDPTSKAVLNHFGVDFESLLSAAERSLSQSKDWKDDHPTGLRMLR